MYRLLPAIPCVFLLAALGCGTAPRVNPSFELTVEDAERAIDEMKATPVKLTRPVVLIGGYFDPGLGPTKLANHVIAATGDQRVIRISTLFDGDFDACREHVIRSVEEAFPSDDPEWTIEVDVIGHSMGGIVGRYCASGSLSPTGGRERAGVRAEPTSGSGAAATGQSPATPVPHKRLRIARLFTISAPHRGAELADLPFFDSRPIAMRRGSPMLQMLDAELADLPYEIVPYVRMGDWIVGTENTSPWDQNVWWVTNQPLQSPHVNAVRDPRILADILRRLRGEAHYTMTPAAPLPKE